MVIVCITKECVGKTLNEYVSGGSTLATYRSGRDLEYVCKWEIDLGCTFIRVGGYLDEYL